MSDLPELLCPAGSPDALAAAIDGGADAIYLGAVSFNARAGAHNFTEEELREGVKLAHAYGARVYVTQNTLIYDREMRDYLRAAESALAAGADALIVADIGGAAEIHRHFPEAELHASTQMSGHSFESAERFARLGYSRMVCAREMSLDDIRTFTAKSPIEAEVFVHGALCVCHSGQCLFSSVVGGRSGNRGECAQPCRLPYAGGYPLSLRDLALGKHIPELIDARVASLKIEGRMKSPEYVRDVTRIYRRLLDERRAATEDEMRELAAIFSRGGFTDGYFTGKISHAMLGTRSEADKENSRALEPFRGIGRKLPIVMEAKISTGVPVTLLVRTGTREGSATGPVPEKAINAPLTRESVTRNLSKLGGTPYALAALDLSLDEDLMLPISALNALRRDAIAALAPTKEPIRKTEAPLLVPANAKKPCRSALFFTPAQITPTAKEWFDILYLPLEKYDGSTSGVALPPVIFDSERPRVEEMLGKAVAAGAVHALVGNIGHLDLAEKYHLVPHGGFRLGVTNTSSAAVLESLGFEELILSPELSAPQIRDIGGRTSAIVYGRLPLMILEKCVGKEVSSCEKCAQGEAKLIDRRGIAFPVLRAWEHRSLIVNSLPTSMSDKRDEWNRTGNGKVGEHYIFTTESRGEVDRVIAAFRSGKPLAGEVRRFPKPASKK